MSISKQQILKIVGLPLISLVVTNVLLTFAAFFISAFPRPMEGESVSVPWPICLLSSLAIAVFVPWLTSLPFLKHSRLRVYFLVCLAVATVVWYFTGLDGLLSKAYRRGL